MKESRDAIYDKQTSNTQPIAPETADNYLRPAENLAIKSEMNRLVATLGIDWQMDEYLYTMICHGFPEFLTPALCAKSDDLVLCLDKTGLKPLRIYLEELNQIDDQTSTIQVNQLILDLLRLIERAHQHMLPITHCSFAADHVFIDTSAIMMSGLSSDVDCYSSGSISTHSQQALISGLRLCFWPVMQAVSSTEMNATQFVIQQSRKASSEAGTCESISIQSGLPSPSLTASWQEALLNFTDLISLISAHIKRPDARSAENNANKLTNMLQNLNFRDAALLIQNSQIISNQKQQPDNTGRGRDKQTDDRQRSMQESVKLQDKQTNDRQRSMQESVKLQDKQIDDRSSGSVHNQTPSVQTSDRISKYSRLLDWSDMYGHWFLVLAFALLWLLLPAQYNVWLPTLAVPALFLLLIHIRAFIANKPVTRQQTEDKAFQISFSLNQLARQWRALFSKRASDDHVTSPYFQTAVQTDQPDLFVMAELCELIHDPTTLAEQGDMPEDEKTEPHHEQVADHGISKSTTGKTAYILTDQFVIGRDPYRTDLYLPYEAIGRQHARIDRKAGSFFITDLGSLNGTTVDGKKIMARETVWLPGQCEIAFAKHRFLFRPDI